MNDKERGRKNRTNGRDFEKRVRKELEKNGWIVNRFDNNVEWDEDNINKPPEKRTGKVIQAKKSFNPFTKRLGYANGFPDFIAYKRPFKELPYVIFGLEVKSGKYLSQEEKDKCVFYLENGVFSQIFIAFKGKKRGEINYVLFEK